MDELQAAWCELKARVDELGAERQQYLDLFELARDAYLITDADGVIREANGAAVDLLQRRRQALRGKPLAVFIPVTRRHAFRSRVRSIAGEAWRSRELVRADEAVIEVDVLVRRAASGALCWRLRPVT
jgi:PAS domain S-box-containing protein